MTTLRILLPLLFALLLSACVPYYYGIREDVWVTMSEPERLAAIDAYRERQLAIQRANEVRAQQQRLELERMRQIRDEEEARHRARIEAFYQMQHAYGDMVRVRLQGGTIRINGHNRAYRPVVFTITDGETRSISIYATNGDIVDLQVAYFDGRLYFDGSPTTRNNSAARLALSLDWELGHIYAGVSTRNVVSLANVEVYVEIIDTRYYDLRRAQLPAIVIHRDARREHYDQRRIDSVRPMQRLNWPDRRNQQLDKRDQQLDRRDQQLDRRDTKLDQREQQLDRYQQQLNQREQELKRDQKEINRDQRQLDRQQQQVESRQQQLDRQQQRQQEPDSRYSRPDNRQVRPEQPVVAPEPKKTLKSQQATTPEAKKPAAKTPDKKQTLFDKRKPTSAKDAKKQAEKKADKKGEEADKKDKAAAEEESDNGKDKPSDKDQNYLKRLNH